MTATTLDLSKVGRKQRFHFFSAYPEGQIKFPKLRLSLSPEEATGQKKVESEENSRVPHLRFPL